MHKTFALSLLFSFLTLSSFSQSLSLTKFDTTASTFIGSKLEQAEYLMRKVKPMGIIHAKHQKIPAFLSGLLTEATPMVKEAALRAYVEEHQLSPKDIGGPLSDSISKNKRGFSAKYFVLHDVSTPNYKFEPIPKNINEDSWRYNDVYKVWDIDKAHLFIGRTGKSISPVFMDIPWRATKFELRILNPEISKGLFIHAEMVQPRRSKKGKWENNDIIAPTPGFTKIQYERVALLYIIASFRSGGWMVPLFHSVLDEGIKNAHDDPQNFSIAQFNKALKKVYAEISSFKSAASTETRALELWATYYYIPQVAHDEAGIDLLDHGKKPTGIKLSPQDWCNACIQGTAIVSKDCKPHLLNYAGRSDSLQYDCRQLQSYKNYGGYMKTGKVLWRKGEGYGEGIKDYKLVPFRSIAVDSSMIPFGSVVFIPEAKGVEYQLEGMTYTHDGYFFAADKGSKIIGNHIDVFIGTATNNPFAFVQSNSNETFRAQVVSDAGLISKFEQMHR